MTAPPGPTSTLGPFLGAPHVRQAVLATLAAWGPLYVAEASRQSGFDLPGFKDFVNEPLMSPETVGERPRYVVAVPRTMGVPERHGTGKYRATWDAQIALWMWGGDYQETQDKLGIYAIAVRQLMLQHPSLGGFAQNTSWRGDAYLEVSATSFRTWGQATVQFAVAVESVVDAYAGPATPPVDPTAAVPAAPAWNSTQLTVNPLR